MGQSGIHYQSWKGICVHINWLSITQSSMEALKGKQWGEIWSSVFQVWFCCNEPLPLNSICQTKVCNQRSGSRKPLNCDLKKNQQDSCLKGILNIYRHCVPACPVTLLSCLTLAWNVFQQQWGGGFDRGLFDAGEYSHFSLLVFLFFVISYIILFSMMYSFV